MNEKIMSDEEIQELINKGYTPKQILIKILLRLIEKEHLKV